MKLRLQRTGRRGPYVRYELKVGGEYVGSLELTSAEADTLKQALQLGAKKLTMRGVACAVTVDEAEHDAQPRNKRGAR